MPETAASSLGFLRLLAGAILDGSAASGFTEQAAAELQRLLVRRRSLVVEARFTGLQARGEPAAVDPLLQRAASQLIVQRVERLGFTADAGAADLQALLHALRPPGGALPPNGVLARLEAAQPSGVYLGTADGAAYRPPRHEPAAAAAGAPEAPPPPAAAATHSDDEPVALGGFDLVEVPTPGAPPAAADGGAGNAPAAAAVAAPPSDGAEDSLFHFFRTASDGAGTRDAAALAAELQRAGSLSRFNELAHQIASEAAHRIDAQEPAETALLLRALAAEARREDRTRVFREAALQMLRLAASDAAVRTLAEWVEVRTAERELLLPLFNLLGDTGSAALETLTLRTTEAALRRAAFLQVLADEGAGRGERLLARAAADTQPARFRALLEAALDPAVAGEIALRWAERAATHPDAAARQQGARLAARARGRTSVRLLVSLLADREAGVRRAAVRALGDLGDPGAVSFLARFLTESDSEELQLDAITALAKIGSGEVVPPLLGIVQRRQLFGGKRLSRLKLAAVAALGRIPARSAREALITLRDGRDAELAAEATRALTAREASS